MAGKGPVSLYDNGMSRARVTKTGDLIQVVIDGGGAMLMEATEFAAVQKWGKAKNSTGAMMTDRNRIFERIVTIVSRPGSVITTRGHEKQLIAMTKLMTAAGMDVNEWNLPPEVKNAKALAEEAEKKMKEARLRNAAHGEAQAEQASRDAAQGGDMDDPYAGLKK